MKEDLREKNITGTSPCKMSGIEGDVIIYVKIEDLVYRTTPYKLATDRTLFNKNGRIKLNKKVEILDIHGKFIIDSKVVFSPIKSIRNLGQGYVYNLILSQKRNIRMSSLQNVVAGHSYFKDRDTTLYGTKTLKLKDSLRGTNFFVSNTSGFDGNEIDLPDWLLRLCGLWVSDGCYAVNRKIIISTGNFAPTINFLRHIPRPPKPVERASSYLEQIIPWENRKKDTVRGEVKKIIDEASAALKLPISTVHLVYYRPVIRNDNLLYCKVKKNGDAWLCCKELVARMISLGFYGLCHDKKIPEWLYTVSKRQIGVFLSGYFDGDGCIQKLSFSSSSVSKDLIYGIKELLWRLGISSGMSINNSVGGFSTKSKHLYCLSVGSVAGSKIFKKEIPMLKDMEKREIDSPEVANRFDFSTARAKSAQLDNTPINIYEINTTSGTFIANYILLGNSK